MGTPPHGPYCPCRGALPRLELRKFASFSLLFPFSCTIYCSFVSVQLLMDAVLLWPRSLSTRACACPGSGAAAGRKIGCACTCLGCGAAADLVECRFTFSLNLASLNAMVSANTVFRMARGALPLLSGHGGAFEAWAPPIHVPYCPCRGALPRPELQWRDAGPQTASYHKISSFLSSLSPLQEGRRVGLFPHP
jgi:hypothetical protein